MRRMPSILAIGATPNDETSFLVSPRFPQQPHHHRFRDTILRFKTTIIITVLLLTAILVAGILYTPPAGTRTMKSADEEQIQKWASKGSACFGGGTVADINTNVTSSGQMLSYVCDGPHLTWKSYATTAIVVVALIGMINNMPPDVTMLTATVALLLLNIINQEQAWRGFSTPGVMAVAVLFVVAQGLGEVGVVDRLLRLVLGSPKSLFVAQIRLMLPVAIISAFMNNTPVVSKPFCSLLCLSQMCFWFSSDLHPAHHHDSLT